MFKLPQLPIAILCLIVAPGLARGDTASSATGPGACQLLQDVKALQAAPTDFNLKQKVGEDLQFVWAQVNEYDAGGNSQLGLNDPGSCSGIQVGSCVLAQFKTATPNVDSFDRSAFNTCTAATKSASITEAFPQNNCPSSSATPSDQGLLAGCGSDGTPPGTSAYSVSSTGTGGTAPASALAHSITSGTATLSGP